MKRKLLATVSISLCLLLSACGGGASEDIQQETGKAEDSGQQEIELTLDNVNDYIDFVSIGENDNNTNNWILINKAYENDMIYVDDNFTIHYEQTFIEYNTQEKTSVLNGFDSFNSILESIDKPIIKEVSGTITFYKDGKAYYDDKEKMRIVQYGNHRNGEGSLRADYFNEYPY